MGVTRPAAEQDSDSTLLARGAGWLPPLAKGSVPQGKAPLRSQGQGCEAAGLHTKSAPGDFRTLGPRGQAGVHRTPGRAATQSVFGCLPVLSLSRLSLAGTLWAPEKGPLRVVSHGPRGNLAQDLPTWPQACPWRSPRPFGLQASS